MADTKRRDDVASLIFIYLWPSLDLYTGTSVDYALIHHEKKTKTKSSSSLPSIETQCLIGLKLKLAKLQFFTS